MSETQGLSALAAIHHDDPVTTGMCGCGAPSERGRHLASLIEELVIARVADAWDEGYAAGFSDELRRVYADMGKRINPYRDRERAAS